MPLPWVPAVSHLCTQVEVAQQDGGLGAGDEEDDEDQEQEAKQIGRASCRERV